MSVRFPTTAAGRAPGDHLCWPYRGVDELVTATREYVAEGLARHELVTYVELGPTGMHQALLSDVAEVGRPAGAGRPVLAPLTAGAPLPTGTDPTVQLIEMTRSAVAEGYSGLRVITDATAQVRTTEGRADWARSEHLIDAFSVEHPVTALCCYDVDELGEASVTALACLHSLTRADSSPFLLRAAGGGTLALSGEVDVLSAEDLQAAMVRIGPSLSDPVVVEVSDLDFIDHGGLVALERAGRALDLRVRLVGASRATGWLVGTLGLAHVSADGSR